MLCSAAFATSFHPHASSTPDPTRSFGYLSPDGLHAWVIEYPALASDTPGVQRLVYTRDAGKTWHEFVSADVKSIRDVLFLGSRGWISDDANGIFETTDGGLHWSRGLGSNRMPMFWNERSGIRLIEDLDEDGRWRGKFEIFYTSDAGATWHRCASDYSRTEYWPTALYVPKRGTAIRGLLIPMDNRQPQRKLGTIGNGGCTWDRGMVDLPNPDEFFSTVHFMDQHRGWVAGEAPGGLYRTDDGGRSWIDLSVPKTHRRIESIYFDSMTSGWMLARNDVYEDKQLFRSADGGRSWHLVPHRVLVKTPLPASWQAGKLYQFLLIVASRQ